MMRSFLPLVLTLFLLLAGALLLFGEDADPAPTGAAAAVTPQATTDEAAAAETPPPPPVDPVPTVTSSVAAPMAEPVVPAATADAPHDPRPQTVIQSEELTMVGEEEINTFFFEREVRVIATNLFIACDRMIVRAAREGDPAATVGEFGSILDIVAEGNVVIEQAGRRATAGRAEVDPGAGTMVLSDHPVVSDGETEIQGWKLLLNRGEQKVRVLSDPEGREADRRVRVFLDALPDMGMGEGQFGWPSARDATNRGENGAPAVGEETEEAGTNPPAADGSAEAADKDTPEAEAAP